MSTSVKYMYRPRQNNSTTSSACSSKGHSNLRRRSSGTRQENSVRGSSIHHRAPTGASVDREHINSPARSRARTRLPFADRRRIIYVLANADANANRHFRTARRYRMLSSESVVMEPSYETVGRRRHLMESRGALNIPPVSTFICFIHVVLYLARENWFDIGEEEDVHVSWEKVWVQGQYWRLFVAQFFHFNRLNMIVNSVTLFTIGRYLERKITKGAMFFLILVMSCVTHIIHTFLCPWFCILPQHEFSSGFGNVIYSLRVLLAYALEPRNYELDLVYGLYPMVVSASHAPWQPVLDLLIFKLVLPEQCIIGQLSGITAGFIVSAFLLFWPAKGVYIANPPYYWTQNGGIDPEDGDPDRDGSSDNWRMRQHTNADFWLPTSSNTMGPISENPSETSTNFVNLSTTHADPALSIPINSIQRRSEEFKDALLDFMLSPTHSIVNLAKSLVRSEMEMEEEQRRNQLRENMIRKSLIKINLERKANSEQVLGRRQINSQTPSVRKQKLRRTSRPRPLPSSSSSSSSASASSSPSPVQERHRKLRMGHHQHPPPTEARIPPPYQSHRNQRRNEMLKRIEKQKLVTLYHMDGGGDEISSTLASEIH